MGQSSAELKKWQANAAQLDQDVALLQAEYNSLHAQRLTLLLLPSGALSPSTRRSSMAPALSQSLMDQSTWSTAAQPASPLAPPADVSVAPSVDTKSSGSTSPSLGGQNRRSSALMAGVVPIRLPPPLVMGGDYEDVPLRDEASLSPRTRIKVRKLSDTLAEKAVLLDELRAKQEEARSVLEATAAKLSNAEEERVTTACRMKELVKESLVFMYQATYMKRVYGQERQTMTEKGDAIMRRIKKLRRKMKDIKGTAGRLTIGIQRKTLQLQPPPDGPAMPDGAASPASNQLTVDEGHSVAASVVAPLSPVSVDEEGHHTTRIKMARTAEGLDDGDHDGKGKTRKKKTHGGKTLKTLKKTAKATKKAKKTHKQHPTLAMGPPDAEEDHDLAALLASADEADRLSEDGRSLASEEMGPSTGAPSDQGGNNNGHAMADTSSAAFFDDFDSDDEQHASASASHASPGSHFTPRRRSGTKESRRARRANARTIQQTWDGVEGEEDEDGNIRRITSRKQKIMDALVDQVGHRGEC